MLIYKYMIEEFFEANFNESGTKIINSYITDPYKVDLRCCSYCGAPLITVKNDDNSWGCKCENDCSGFKKETSMIKKYNAHYSEIMGVICKLQEKLKTEEEKLISYEKEHAKVTLAKLYFAGKEQNDADRATLESELMEVLNNEQ